MLPFSFQIVNANAKNTRTMFNIESAHMPTELPTTETVQSQQSLLDIKVATSTTTAVIVSGTPIQEEKTYIPNIPRHTYQLAKIIKNTNHLPQSICP